MRILRLLFLIMMTGIPVGSALGEVSLSDSAAVHPDDDPDPATTGRNVFLDYCSFCHDLSTKSNDTDTQGEPPGLRRHNDGEMYSRTELQDLIRNPPEGMPILPLKEEQFHALLDYLTQIPPQKIMIDLDHP